MLVAKIWNAVVVLVNALTLAVLTKAVPALTIANVPLVHALLISIVRHACIIFSFTIVDTKLIFRDALLVAVHCAIVPS